jgi:hypothetical protein
VEDIVDAFHHATREFLVGQISLDEFNGRQVIEIAPSAGDQGVRHTHAVTAPNEFF